MPLSVVVGGQYGSEGKGKLVSYLAGRESGSVAVVRCGGSNSGHTAEWGSNRHVLRQVPSGAVVDNCQLFMAAGMQIDLGLLSDELARLHVGPEQLRIDPNATLLEPQDSMRERQADLLGRIGSTLTGTGAAIARRVLRDESVRRACDVPCLQPYIADVSRELQFLLRSGTHVIVEGTQGAGLSLYHGAYPYVTGRDTTAAGFLSEVGLPPMSVTDVIVVLRTYPIRVGGHSGPLDGEVDWSLIQARSGAQRSLGEFTSVTGRLRRVGEFDWDLAMKAVALNGPTALAIHGVDYISGDDWGVRRWCELSSRSRAFVEELERRLDVPVRYVFTGSGGMDVIERDAGSGAADLREVSHAREKLVARAG